MQQLTKKHKKLVKLTVSFTTTLLVKLTGLGKAIKLTEIETRAGQNKA